MSAFYVIDTEAKKIGMVDMFGPYETRAAAEAFIRKDFADWWDNSEIPLADRDDECSSTWLVLQELAEVRPVAKTTLKTVLQEVKG